MNLKNGSFLLLTSLLAFLVIATACSSISKSGKDTPVSFVDVAGSYDAILPCADCNGIMARLVIDPEGGFHLNRQYLKENESNQEELIGKCKWDEEGPKRLILAAPAEELHLVKSGNNLLLVNPKGEIPTGSAADKYLFTRELEAHYPTLTNTRWVLTGLLGFGEDLSASAYMMLSDTGFHVSGMSGCNRFFGKYELLQGNKIRFFNLASTMMACAEDQMKLEQAFLSQLRTIDNYTLTPDGGLHLQKARTAPLLRFRND